MAANLDKSENALTNVTTVTYVRGIDASGNSVKISTANLASVLGAFVPCGQLQISANDITESGCWGVTAVRDTPEGYGFLLCFNANAYYRRFQIFIKSNGTAFWVRSQLQDNTEWISWARYSSAT